MNHLHSRSWRWMNPELHLTLALDLAAFILNRNGGREKKGFLFSFSRKQRREREDCFEKSLAPKAGRIIFLSSAPAPLQIGDGLSLHWNDVQGLIYWYYFTVCQTVVNCESLGTVAFKTNHKTCHKLFIINIFPAFLASVALVAKAPRGLSWH